MIWTLFGLGVACCLGCGWNTINANADSWKEEAAWIAGGAVGAAMIISAIWFRHIGVAA